MRIQNHQTTYNQSIASSAVATTCNRNISCSENNFMEGSQQGTNRGCRVQDVDIKDLTNEDGSVEMDADEASMQDLVLGVNGVEDDNGTGRDVDESLTYSISMASNDCDMSISCDDSRTLNPSAPASGRYKCLDCYTYWNESFCSVCSSTMTNKGDKDIVKGKDFKKEEWNLTSQIGAGSFFRVCKGGNTNSRGELYIYRC